MNNTIGYRRAVSDELQAILRYWMERMPDEGQGGFFGRIDGEGLVHPGAPRGLVLNSRILWSFSAAYRNTGDPGYLPMARRAYEYLALHFVDRENGGAFWSVAPDGTPLETRKQIYGLAFFIYGLSEYYAVTGEEDALEAAVSLFRLIERHSFDTGRKGYKEAFTRDWQSLDDLRLSEKDANEQKTMNTHLHLLEAYTNLYRSWPDVLLLQRIKDLLEVFTRYIVDGATGHLGLFFGDDWSVRSALVSYGHDIEAGWLLHEAAIVTGDGEWMIATRRLAVMLAAAAAEGLDEDGGLWHERKPDSRKSDGAEGRAAPTVRRVRGADGPADSSGLVREKHWWPQAEAMIGFLNAWELTGEAIWFERSLASWAFIQRWIRDPAGGEWYWGVRADHSPMPGEDKAGFWKCPYHNSRACLEIMRRLGGGGVSGGGRASVGGGG
jgi:mannobiose 2-epimerase